LPKQFLAFCTIGIINTTVDFIVFFMAIELLAADKIVANIIAWFIAVQLSYVMNSRFTFHEAFHQLNFKALAKFMLSGIVGLVVSTISLLILNQFMDLMLAKLFSIFIGLVFNFTLAKYFVFVKAAS
jgi:putative flippase GtrA